MTELWDGPVELHFWNGRLEVRDVKKKTMFYLELDTREYWTVKKLKDLIAPKIVEMMNRDIVPQPVFANSINAVEEFLNAPPVKKRGRPRRGA